MQQCAKMNRRTLTMNWDGLGDEDEDDRFFDPSSERASSAAPLDLCSSGSDEDNDFEDSRMSFVSTVSSASCKNSKSPSVDYDMWMSEPGDIGERRKRLLQGMGLSSTKDILKNASMKLVGAVSRKHVHTHDSGSSPVVVARVDPPAESKAAPKAVKPHSSPEKVSRSNEPSSTSSPHSHSQPPVVVLVRSRSDSDIEALSARTKQRKEELIGPVSKQKLTRTSSGVSQSSSSAVRISQQRSNKGMSFSLPKPNNDVLQSVASDSGLGSFFLIKNLDTGNEFIVKEYNEQGMWNKLRDVQTGKQMTMEEFEKSVGYSPAVKHLMRRKNIVNAQDSKKFNHNSYFSKSFRNSKRKGAAFLKNIKGVASSKSLSIKEQEQSPPEDQQKGSTKATSNWIKVRQHGKSYKEFTALYVSQEIQAHEGPIGTMKFSFDARLLASGGEDKVIHVWEVQECDVMSTRTSDDSCPASGTLVHPKAGNVSDRLPLEEITAVPPKKKGKNSKKKGDTMPDYVDVPETVFALSDKPVCSFTGHQDEVLDLAWSRSQLLLSSSMDKTVRLWDMETKSCLKMFAHNDYVTCIQFNPVDENYFISGSLDAKVRIWSIPERQVVDWTDVHEMVTAGCYTPDGQGVIIGTHQGICRFYSANDCKLEHTLEIQMKTKSQSKKLPGFQNHQIQIKKITGFQFAPWNPAEVLITSTDSRIRIHNGPDLIQKYRGFRNTSSQISACFSPDGKHVISASEDSQVYIWKVAESKNPGGVKKRSKITVRDHEHFQCKDVTVAIAWPGSTKNEPPIIEIHSKRHSKRITSPSPSSPHHEDNAASRRHLPPLPKKNIGLERIDSTADEDFASSAKIDPGIGISGSFRSSSGSISYRDSPSISSIGAHGGQTVQATAWGMVIVTASLEGEIRVYQNFGLPRKV